MITHVAGRVSEVFAADDDPGYSAGVFTRRNLTVAALLSAAALALYLVLAKSWHLPIKASSPFNYFGLQASAWLHLRWDLVNLTSRTDLIRLHGEYYSIYGPFPALLMVPLVALFGSANDVLFTMVISAANLGLLFLLFEQLRANGLTRRGWRENAVWSVLLYIGSTALFLSLTGYVWYTGHIVSCACLLISLLLAFRRHFVWSAVALSCAFLSRSTLLLGFPFLLYLAWQDGGAGHLFEQFIVSVRARRPDWSSVPWRRLSGVIAVLGACLAVYMARNWAMFGNPLESGYEIQRVQHYPFVIHGVFNLRYIPANLINDFFNFPHIMFPTHYSDAPMIDMQNGANGTCVFLTTPLFLLLFWRNRQRSWLRVALWASLLLLMAFVLMFYTAGYPQFGTRYLFDIYPYAWLLLIISDVRMDWHVVVLGAIGLVINFLGDYQHWLHLPFLIFPHWLHITLLQPPHLPLF